MKLEHANASVIVPIGALHLHWAIYTHQLIVPPTPSDAGIFFIGLCKFYDVFKYPDAHKNTYWRATITEETMVETRIVFSTDDMITANRTQSELIRAHRPVCNIKGYLASGRAMITCVDGPKKGQYWDTQENAARDNGIAQPTLSNHLNGRPGYETVRGMKFKRGL